MSSNNSCDSCSCDKKKKIENFNGDNIEHFSYEAPKNMCHYACSSINSTNVLLCILIIVLFIFVIKGKINFNLFK